MQIIDNRYVRLLKGGVFAPSPTFLLNPESEGKKKYLYLFWTAADEEHADITMAGCYYGLFSDHDFLHLYGKKDARIVLRKEDLWIHEQARDEAAKAIQAIFDEAVLSNPLETEGNLVICWVKCDNWQEQPTGLLTMGFEKKE